jgi:hypothetical protein
MWGNIIMAGLVRLRFAAVAMIAAATIASTTASGWAFSQQTLSVGPEGNGNYNFNYTDPNHPAASSQNSPQFDSNSPTFHFSIDHGESGQFSGFQSGNRSLGNSDPTSPQYYMQGR